MPDTARWRIPAEIAALIDAELSTARRSDEPWPALERAHLLSQPWAWTHTRYPPGNTGRTTMRLTETAPLPPDVGHALAPFTSPS